MADRSTRIAAIASLVLAASLASARPALTATTSVNGAARVAQSILDLGRNDKLSFERVNTLRRVAGVLVVAATCDCARHNPTPAELADFTTRAVYDADALRTTTYFDAGLRPTVTPQSVAAVSKLMHRYGTYQGVAQPIEITKDARYDFEAQFSGGAMLVRMKLGNAGKTITAYHVIPVEPDFIDHRIRTETLQAMLAQVERREAAAESRAAVAEAKARREYDAFAQEHAARERERAAYEAYRKRAEGQRPLAQVRPETHPSLPAVTAPRAVKRVSPPRATPNPSVGWGEI